MGRQDEAPRLFSQLYSRVNGFMLGVFTVMCHVSFARERFPFYRHRIRAFFDEVGIALPVPDAFDASEWDGFDRRLSPELQRRSPTLWDFWIIGLMSVNFMDAVGRHRPNAEVFRRAAHDAFERHKLSFAAFDSMVPRTGRSERSVHGLVSPPLGLLTELIRPLRPEPRTCFIAQKFEPPYEEYYSSLYRPMLAKAGFRPLRAWGGFGDEDYSPALVAMIMKSGAFLADITEADPNVMWEVGVAQGAGKPTYLLQELSDIAPANLQRHVTMQYDIRKPDWRSELISGAGVLMSMQAVAMEKVEKDPIRLVSGIREDEVSSVATSIMDTFEEVRFHAMRERGENDANERLRRGLERFRKERYADALSDFDYAVARGGVPGVAQLWRGIALLQLSRFAEADDAFTAALRAGLTDEPLRQLRGRARMQIRRFAGARRDFDEALAVSPEDVEAVHCRAYIAAQQGDEDACAADCATAARLAPGHAWTIAIGGYLHLLRNEFPQAAKAFRDARSRSRGKSWRFEAAVAEALAGRTESAVRELERGLRRASDDDIDDGLRMLRHWVLRGKRVPLERRKLARQLRRRMLEVRTPRAWQSS